MPQVINIVTKRRKELSASMKVKNESFSTIDPYRIETLVYEDMAVLT